MFRLSLRQKLLLVSSLILVVPWLGLRYVKAIEDYLQHIILDNLTAYTQSVSANIALQSEVIPTFPSGQSLYAAPLSNEPALDGYDSDWGDFSQPATLLQDKQSSSNSTIKVGRYGESLYLFLTVRDSDVQYYQSSYSLSDNLRKLELWPILIQAQKNTRRSGCTVSAVPSTGRRSAC